MSERKTQNKMGHNYRCGLDAAPIQVTAFAAAQGKPTRSFVHECVISLTGADAQDDTPITSVPGLNADDLGGCLNDRIPLSGSKRFRSGDIANSDTLKDVTNAADVRRNQP